MKSMVIRAELMRNGQNAAKIARACRCDESVVSKLINSGLPGRKGTVRRLAAKTIARKIGCKFADVWPLETAP